MIVGLNQTAILPPDIHIVGMGGSGTSGMAQILRSRGVHVSGSDTTRDSIEPLLRAGFPVEVGHRPENLNDRVRLVVHSAAIPVDNPELVESRRRGLEVLKYAQFLGRLLEESFGIAVAGTHGKTSTGAMLASVWIAAGREPTVLLGGSHPDLGGNWRAGSGNEFVVEACEYDRSFLSLRPRAAIITNLELDHPDIYADLDAVQSSFAEFLRGVRDPGVLVIGDDGVGARTLPRPSGSEVISFGFREDATWRATICEGGAAPLFEAFHRGVSWGRFRLRVAGRHSVLNALGVIALAEALGLDRAAIAAGLAGFPGVDRRFEHRGAVGGVDWVDDFAHHPTELATAIETARDVFPDRRLVVAFQPHQFGRLRSFSDGFAEQLARADRVALFPVYSVREEQADDARSLLESLGSAIERSGTPLVQFDSFDDAAARLPARLREGDVVLACGAGSLPRFTDRMFHGVPPEGGTR